MVRQRRQTLSYSLFGMPVADCHVEREDDEHPEEDGPFDDDAGLVGRERALAGAVRITKRESTARVQWSLSRVNSPSSTKRE